MIFIEHNFATFWIFVLALIDTVLLAIYLALWSREYAKFKRRQKQ